MRLVMSNSRWTFVRALFNKELDEEVREKMKSRKYLASKGITNKAAIQQEIRRIDGTPPEQSYLLNQEFFKASNRVFTDLEKGPKVRYMAS